MVLACSYLHNSKVLIVAIRKSTHIFLEGNKYPYPILYLHPYHLAVSEQWNIDSTQMKRKI